MEGRFGMGADEGVQVLVGLGRRARADLPAPVAVESRLREDLAGDANGVAKLRASPDRSPCS